MSKPGNYTAYQQYKPLDNGTTQALQHWSGFAEQKRQNDINNEQLDRQLKNQEDKEVADQMRKLLDAPQVDLTGVGDVDQFKATIATDAYQRRLPIVEKILGLPLNSKERVKEELKLKAIDENLKAINFYSNNNIQDGQKYHKDKDKLWVQTKENDNAFANLAKPKLVFDEETGRYSFLVPDPNDPTKEIAVSSQQMLEGASQFNLIPKFSDTKWIQENIKLLNAKPPSYMDIDPATNKPILKTGYDKEKAIKPYVQTTLFIENEPTEQGLSFGAQLGYNTKQLQDPAIQEQLVNHYTDRLYSALTGGTKLDKDSENIRIAEQKLAQKTANDAAKLGQGWAKINLKSQELIGTGKIQSVPDPNVDFVTKSNQEGKSTFGVNIAENKFSIVNQNEDVTVEQQIRDISIDPKDNGKVIVTGTIYEETPGDFSGKKPTKTDFNFDSSSADGLAQVEKGAAHLGMNRQQLYDLIKNRMHKKKKEASSPKPKAKANPTETLEERKKRLGLK